jgi:hypothetical protein
MNKSISTQLISIPASNSRNYFILFILWPFLAFLLALKNYSQKEARKVVYLFLIYYGLTFVLGNFGADAEAYALRLQNTAKLPFSDFFKIVGGIYATDTSVDIAEPFISFIVSRFTSYHGIYFAIWAAIFGFFYLKSVNLLHNRYQEKPGINAKIIMAFFIILLPITNINSVRMWTAAWIFFYGAYYVILFRDARYLLITLGASLVHWSFLSANVILIVYYFAGNRNFVYLPLAILSFVLPKIIAPTFQTVSIALGGALQGRFNMYSNEGYVLERQELFDKSAWFIKIGNDLVLYYLLLAIIVIQFRFGSVMKEKAERNLFSFLLLFLSFVNFGKDIPSFGGRFQIIFFLFASLYVFLYFIKLQREKVSLLTWVGLFPMVLYAAIAFRIGSDSISAWILTPGFGLPLLVPGLSIADILFH